MKGNLKVIAALSTALAEKLAAINQYMVHAEMYDNWGYTALHARFEKIAREEMRHAGMIIARIIFLEGKPLVNVLGKIKIGEEPSGMITNDHANELNAVKLYNELTIIAVAAGDNATREMAESILKEAEGHIEIEEAQLAQIGQLGIQLFLAGQTGE